MHSEKPSNSLILKDVDKLITNLGILSSKNYFLRILNVFII